MSDGDVKDIRLCGYLTPLTRAEKLCKWMGIKIPDYLYPENSVDTVKFQRILAEFQECELMARGMLPSDPEKGG